MGAAQACPSEQTTATEFPFWVLSCACVWSRALSICRVPQDRCLLLSDRAHRGGMCPVSGVILEGVWLLFSVVSLSKECAVGG